MDVDGIVAWVVTCQHNNGGFSAAPEHDPHMLYTLSAIQVNLYMLVIWTPLKLGLTDPVNVGQNDT